MGRDSGNTYDIGFLNLGTMRDERENQWKPEERKERKSKKHMLVDY